MDEFEMEQMHYEIDAMRVENEGVRAAYEALRQASADLCVVCGWRFFVPDVGCQGCERARLEAENERMRAHRELCTENLLKGYETGKAEERAAVVAWLREVSPNAPTRRGADELAWCADAIERGEHRREEEKP